MYLELIENIRSDMRVDDLLSGGNILSRVEVIKQKSTELFAKDASTNISGIQIYYY